MATPHLCIKVPSSSLENTEVLRGVPQWIFPLMQITAIEWLPVGLRAKRSVGWRVIVSVGVSR